MTVRIIKKATQVVQQSPEPIGKTKAFRVVKRKALSSRQEIVRDIVLDEVSKSMKSKKGRKSKADILRAANYSPSVVDHPDKVFEAEIMREALEPILNRLVRHRDRVLERMEKLLETAGYTSLSITVTNLNRDIELLSGRPTAREEHVLPQEEQDKLDELLKLNS